MKRKPLTEKQREMHRVACLAYRNRNLEKARAYGAEYRKNNREAIRLSCRVPVNKDSVVCQICQQSLGRIVSSHLKNHGTTVDAYRRRFPHSKLVSKRLSDFVSNAAKRKAERDRLEYGGKDPDSLFFEFLVGALLGDRPVQDKVSKKMIR